MELKPVDRSELNRTQKKNYDFQKVAALLADYGFNCIRLADDADDGPGADFLACHKDGRQTLKVQLKGHLSIGKKYMGKDLYMAFPINGSWYLVSHDELVRIVGETTNALNTSSWQKGQYNWRRPSQRLVAKLSFSLIRDIRDKGY